MEVEYVPRIEFKSNKQQTKERLQDLNDISMNCKAALQNHTAHITKLKRHVEGAATKKELAQLAEHTSKFALNKELQDLYQKVVPTVTVMEGIGRTMQETVATLTEVVGRFDVTLCQKANKQELLIVDNKFRLFVKKDNFEPF